jgi:hypothetical protein
VFKSSRVHTMFKMSGSSLDRHRDSEPASTNYCISEEFSGDLATGSLLLGEQTAAAHGLNGRSSGLLAITRVYAHQDRVRVLTIFEQACIRSTHFSFNATILRADGTSHPVLCSGETLVSSDGQSGRIKGVFVLSSLKLH